MTSTDDDKLYFDLNSDTRGALTHRTTAGNVHCGYQSPARRKAEAIYESLSV